MVELCLCQTLMVYPTAAAIQCNTLAQSNHVLHAGTLQLGIHNGSSSNVKTVYVPPEVIYNVTGKCKERERKVDIIFLCSCAHRKHLLSMGIRHRVNAPCIYARCGTLWFTWVISRDIIPSAHTPAILFFPFLKIALDCTIFTRTAIVSAAIDNAAAATIQLKCIPPVPLGWRALHHRKRCSLLLP